MTATETIPQKTAAVAKAKPLSVCMIVSSLEFGGAERQVVEMVRSFDRSRIQPFIISLSKKVPLAKFLPGGGECLNIVPRGGRLDFATYFRVAKILRERNVDVAHAFLFDAEIITRLAARMTNVKLVVASERNANYQQRGLHRWALKVTQPLFDVMVANSETGKRFNVATRGIRASKIEVVRNGVDIKKFQPNPAARAAIRKELGIPETDPVVGMVGSFKYQKGHEFFLRMAAEVRKEFPNAWFLVLGEVPERASTAYYDEIFALSKSLNLGDRCRFLGARNDMDSVHNAFDILALLSRHEGTPNVVLEAMACGVPVVASDVCDNPYIIREGETGFIVPMGDAAQPAARVLDLFRQPEKRLAMGKNAREHVCREFSFQRVTTQLADIYDRYIALKGTNG